MTTVPENLEKILRARYGEEVRGAIHDSIADIYTTYNIAEFDNLKDFNLMIPYYSKLEKKIIENAHTNVWVDNPLAFGTSYGGMRYPFPTILETDDDHEIFLYVANSHWSAVLPGSGSYHQKFYITENIPIRFWFRKKAVDGSIPEIEEIDRKAVILRPARKNMPLPVRSVAKRVDIRRNGLNSYSIKFYGTDDLAFITDDGYVFLDRTTPRNEWINLPSLLPNFEQYPEESLGDNTGYILLRRDSITDVVSNYILGYKPFYMNGINYKSLVDERTIYFDDDATYRENGRYLILAIRRPTGNITTSKNNVYFDDEPISIDEMIDEVKNEPIKLSPNLMQVFKTYTVIGDSLACGYTKVGDTMINSDDARRSGNNWPGYLERRTGSTFNNIAVGGTTAKDWRDRLFEQNDKMTCDCYLIGMGVNDERQNLPVGTSSDIKTSYDDNADSFYGNYDALIRMCRGKNPKARIFCFTIPASETNKNLESYNEAIRHVASLYQGVYCIDLYNLYKNEYTSPPISSGYVNGHYYPVVYNYMSVLIEKAICDYIYDNQSEFQEAPYNL